LLEAVRFGPLFIATCLWSGAHHVR